jgi:hypothetical protein
MITCQSILMPETTRVSLVSADVMEEFGIGQRLQTRKTHHYRPSRLPRSSDGRKESFAPGG